MEDKTALSLQVVEEDVLVVLGFDEWEGVAVGFLLSKVRYFSGRSTVVRSSIIIF